jgi:hypothetical protein
MGELHPRGFEGKLPTADKPETASASRKSMKYIGMQT